MSKLDAKVAAVIDNIDDAEKQADCRKLIAMMEKHTGKPARLFPFGAIGFGRVRYKYPSGHTGETYLTGFAPRKANLSLHVLWYQCESDPLLQKLGKHKAGKGCLYIKKLADVDVDILDQIIRRSATELDGRFITQHLED